MNACARWALSLWRANMDIQILTSHHDIMGYVLKYALKPEIRSENASTILDMANIDPNTNM